MSSSLPPGALALGMLPMSTVEGPRTTAMANTTLYEYPVYGAVSLADESEWPTLALTRLGPAVRLLKPSVGQSNLQVPGRLTSQPLDIRYTTFAFETDLYPLSQTPGADAFFQALADLIHLLRTVARHYWLGLAIANEGHIFQAVRTRIEAGSAEFQGAGSFKNPFIVKPIDQQVWRFLAEMLEKGYSPSNSEVILCDALLEVRRGALLNAVLLLGVACEIEINTLIEQLAGRSKISNNASEKLMRREFKKKFTEVCVTLGTSDPLTATVMNFPADWAQTVCDLYTARNKVAHSGECLIKENGTQTPLEMRHIPKLIHSADALLCWANAERRKLGIPQFLTATMLPGGYPILAFVTPGP